MNVEISELQATLRAFAAERDWEQFHSPKNLATAMSIEAAELLEHFQWLTDEQSRSLPSTKREEIAEEVADVFLYLLQLSDKLCIDPLDAARKKLKVNAVKYPVERAKGIHLEAVAGVVQNLCLLGLGDLDRLDRGFAIRVGWQHNAVDVVDGYERFALRQKFFQDFFPVANGLVVECDGGGFDACYVSATNSSESIDGLPASGIDQRQVSIALPCWRFGVDG